MKALILNSGLGSRMGVLTSEHPKCMTEISARETILSRQLQLIADAGILEQKILLADNEYVVIGDNIENSKDSRFTEVGIVNKNTILGTIISIK